MSEADHGHEAASPEKPGEPPQPAPPAARWPWIAAGLVVVVSVGVVAYLVYAPKPNVWTNDAYVQVHYATIAPRVAGQIKSVRADNNESVKAGDVLVGLDDRDYVAARDSAAAALKRDEARVDDARATLTRQHAAIDQAKAQVDSASTQLAQAQADADRAEWLQQTGAGAVKTREQADTTLLQGKSSLSMTRATLASQQDQLKVLQASIDAAVATVQGDKAALDRASLNLSYTLIHAPIDGMVAQRSVQVGNYVGPGAALMAVVPLQDVYIEANYLEVQLRHVKAGQRVKIHVDAYNVDLDGTVVGVPAATGATFAAIPSENATGNFTKIVQRLPVEIHVEPNQPLAKLLRVGLSVETTIATDLANVVGEQRASSKDITADPGSSR